MATHEQIRAAKEEVLEKVKRYIVENNGTVCLNETVFEMFGKSVFSKAGIFTKFIKEELTNDPEWKIKAVRKWGTFVCSGDQELKLPQKVVIKRQTGGRKGRPPKKIQVSLGGASFTGVRSEVEFDPEMWEKQEVPTELNELGITEIYSFKSEGISTEGKKLLALKGRKQQYIFSVNK